MQNFGYSRSWLHDVWFQQTHSSNDKPGGRFIAVTQRVLHVMRHDTALVTLGLLEHILLDCLGLTWTQILDCRLPRTWDKTHRLTFYPSARVCHEASMTARGRSAADIASSVSSLRLFKIDPFLARLGDQTAWPTSTLRVFSMLDSEKSQRLLVVRWLPSRGGAAACLHTSWELMYREVVSCAWQDIFTNDIIRDEVFYTWNDTIRHAIHEGRMQEG